MLNLLQTFLFAGAMVMLGVLVFIFRKRISLYYGLLFSSVVITNFGYMQIANATNTGMGIYGNQTTYLGACFAPFFLLMCIADLCNVVIKRRYQLLLFLSPAVVFLLSCTVGYKDWFYRSVRLEKYKGMSYLIKDYGSLHVLQPINLILLFTVGTMIVMSSFKRKKDVSYITGWWLLFCMGLTIGTYFVERMLNIKVELISVAYLFSESVIVILLRRYNLIDVANISAEAMAQSMEHGFVLCDTKGRYLGADPTAKMWFPELEEQTIDRRFRKEDTEFLKLLGRWARGEEKSESVSLTVVGAVIEASYSVLKEMRNDQIFCIYLRDDTQDHMYHSLLEEYSAKLEADVHKKTERIRRIQNDITVSMASIVENRDSNTGGHIVRTSDVVNIFVGHLLENKKVPGLTPRTGELIRKAAPLHDFGKIAIPDSILNKPGKFENWEYDVMKQHAAKGAVIVEQILKNSDDEEFKRIAIDVAHYHHEKWNGTGYPDGLKETQIPFAARVMALADVFDALVSKRVYKEKFDYDRAFSIIEESCGSHFDPLLCEEFLHCRKELEKLYDSYEDEK